MLGLMENKKPIQYYDQYAGWVSTKVERKIKLLTPQGKCVTNVICTGINIKRIVVVFPDIKTGNFRIKGFCKFFPNTEHYMYILLLSIMQTSNLS